MVCLGVANTCLSQRISPFTYSDKYGEQYTHGFAAAQVHKPPMTTAFGRSRNCIQEVQMPPVFLTTLRTRFPVRLPKYIAAYSNKRQKKEAMLPPE
jgi:hypothetical protein